MKRICMILGAALLGGCAAYSGHGLVAGQDGLPQVIALMGQPAMQWRETDGAQELAYPRGPVSPETYMVRISADGKVQAVRNVLTTENFARIKPGMTLAEVQRILGPASAVDEFPRRNERVRDWPTEDMGDPAHFLVLFDATREIVRTTVIQADRPPSMN